MEMRSDSSLVVYETVSVMFQIASVMFNVPIICTLAKKSLIRCPSNKFVFSICLSHLFISILSLLISAIQMFTINESRDELIDISGDDSQIETNSIPISLNFVLTHILLYLTLTATLGTGINVALISIERYITISHPMNYKSIVTPRRCTSIILICWALASLAVLLPIFLFDNQTVLLGSFAMPGGRLGLYYAILFTCVTILVLSVMSLCYLHIYMIAKEKCQKLQIGHFTSPVSSISSDWPSTAYSSQAEGQLVCQIKCTHSSCPMPTTTTTATQRLLSPNSSLLQYVLLANLGRDTHPQFLRESSYASTPNDTGREPASETKIIQKPTDVQTRLSRNGQDFHHHHHHHHNQPIIPPLQQPKRWKTFLKQNYNSPKKTVSTIVMLIGSLALTQLPLSIALFFPSQGVPLFYFCVKLIFPLSSLSNPILYGFLNRTIRAHLLKFLRVRRRQGGGFMTPGRQRNIINGRKASISSADSTFKKEFSGVVLEEEKILTRNPRDSIQSNHCVGVNTIRENLSGDIKGLDPVPNENSVGEGILSRNSEGGGDISENLDEIVIELGDINASNFPRKPSQDSGVDITFIDEEEGGGGEEKEKGGIKKHNGESS